MKKNIFKLKQFCIDQTHAGMKVGTDSDLLGTMARGGRRILDIGTGTGIIALMMAQRYPEAILTAIEIDDNAVIDAATNFAASPWADRLTLVHDSFQNYVHNAMQVVEGESDCCDGKMPGFDAIVCNPPYFDRSLECPDLGRMRARHSSSLPFDVLMGGAYRLLEEGGFFSVCIPPEVLDDFLRIGEETGFQLFENNQVQALPDNPPKRYVLVFRKSEKPIGPVVVNNYCMRNSDHTYTDWYRLQLKDFLTGKIF